jgi:hypothetical protein
MLIDIYQSATYRSHYLAVPHKADVTKLQISDGAYAMVEPFPRTEDFQPGDNRTGVDTDAVLTEIIANGYALFSARITVTIGEPRLIESPIGPGMR